MFGMLWFQSVGPVLLHFRERSMTLGNSVRFIKALGFYKNNYLNHQLAALQDGYFRRRQLACGSTIEIARREASTMIRMPEQLVHREEDGLGDWEIHNPESMVLTLDVEVPAKEEGPRAAKRMMTQGSSLGEGSRRAGNQVPHGRETGRNLRDKVHLQGEDMLRINIGEKRRRDPTWN